MALKTFSFCGVIALGLLSFSLDVSAQGAPAWVKRFHHVSSAKDIPTALTTDSSGNFIVAGDIERKEKSWDIVLIKYSGAGIALWTNYYDGTYHGRDNSWAVAVDENDNVYVAGTSEFVTSRQDVLTLAYSSAGVPLWTNRFMGNGEAGYPDTGKALVVRSNLVYVLSSTCYVGKAPVPEYATVVYTTAGVPVRTNIFNQSPNNGLGQNPSAIALGPQGEVFVTGQGNLYKYPDTFAAYTTIKYSSTGTALWTNRYLEPNLYLNYNYPNAMVSDPDGNIYVAGFSGHNWNTADFATVAYSSAGAALWTNRYNGSGQGMDTVNGLVIGPGENIYVTGTSAESGSGNDYTTIAYSKAGVPLWTNRFDGGLTNSDAAAGIVTDGTNIFVTGSSGSLGGASDIRTIAYSESGVPLWTNSFAVAGGTAVASKIAYTEGRLAVLGSLVVAGNSDLVTVAYSTSGAPLWTNIYNGVIEHAARANAVAADHNGNVYVTGRSSNVTTIAYAPNGTGLWTNRFYFYRASFVATDNSNGVYVNSGSFQAIKYSGQGTLLWSNDPAPTVSTDVTDIAVADNRVHIVGDESYLRTVTADTGAHLWLKADSKPVAVAPGPNGSVYVTGYSGTDCSTIGYGANGNFILNQRFGYQSVPQGQATGVDVAVGANSNVYVAARAYQTYGTDDFITLAYSSAGLPLWTNFYSASDTSLDSIQGLVVDNDSNVYVTGASANAAAADDYVTIAYSPSGVALWTNRYDRGGSEQPKGIATDNENVYVTGTASASAGFSTADIVTVAYSKTGVPLWTNRYDGPAHGTDALTYTAKPITVVPDGVVVVGNSQNSEGLDEYVVIKYSKDNQAPVSSGFGAATLRNQPLEITELNLLAAASDPEGGPVSLFSVPINTANGGTLAQNAGVITYTPPPGFVGADQFTYVVSDNQGATANVLARIAVLPSGTVIHAFATPAITPGTTALNFAGAPGDTWSIYRAEQLDGPWTKIGVMTIPSSGLGQFQDLNSPSTAAFYRAAKP